MPNMNYGSVSTTPIEFKDIKAFDDFKSKIQKIDVIKHASFEVCESNKVAVHLIVMLPDLNVELNSPDALKQLLIKHITPNQMFKYKWVMVEKTGYFTAGVSEYDLNEGQILETHININDAFEDEEPISDIPTHSYTL